MGARPAAATRIAFAVVVLAGPLVALLPGPGVDPLLFGIDVVLTLALLAVASISVVRDSPSAQLWLSLAYLGLVGVDAPGGRGTVGRLPSARDPARRSGSRSTARRRQLLIALGATAVVLLVPWALIGGERYPDSTIRSALLVLVVAALAGLTIQRLLAEMRSNRDRLAGVLGAATGNAIIAMDLEGRVTVFNPGAERMLGYRADEVIGRIPDFMLDLDELAVIAAEFGVAPEFASFVARAARDETESHELTYVRKDGTRLRVSQRLTVERDPDGHVIGFLGVASDISEQLRAQVALRAERDFTEAVLETAGSLVIVTDRGGRIERFNRAAEQVTGLRRRRT